MGLLSALGMTPDSVGGSSKPLALGRLGVLGAVAGFLPGEVLQSAMHGLVREAIDDAEGPGTIVLYMVMATALSMAVYAVAYSIALTIGQNRYLHRPWLGAREAFMGVGGGAIVGLVSGGLAEGFFKVAQATGAGSPLFVEAARIVAWSIFGGLIGLGMSFIIPNLGRLQGLLGGAAGGGVGAVGFIMSTAIAGDAAGRFIGMAIVGCALGYAIGLVEEASRAAWLQVSYGNSRETVKVSLGPDLVCVGSNAQRCAIWAQGARSIALRFRYVDGKVTCDDMASERTIVVDPGFQQQVGNVSLVVCVGGAAHPAPAARPAPPPPPAPSPRPVSGGSTMRAAAAASAVPSVPMPAHRRAPPPPPPPPPRG